MACCYSTLDLTMGYWQDSLDSHVREKTAFCTTLGCLEPQQRFSGLSSICTYLDDIIINFSNEWQRHVQHLRAVLGSQRQEEITANPKKFATGQVEVWNFWVFIHVYTVYCLFFCFYKKPQKSLRSFWL